ncbi:LysR substrate-binding domain-containing protein [Azospirillum sp. B506]|uniref:LysR substrate-binding domain-containing protein n=1 Tax=Azospirillum sp. B506 TaxID=137721 RepID=UPI000344CD8B|nr:LysR substrate-binding domain-containing protein [Azospirillum sp. B506]
MPKRPLPPLNTLRGFDAAARHLSFTLAANELHLTQGAISRQVRDLELALDCQLFRRMTRRIELTPEGEDFARTVRDCLGELERSAQRIGRSRTTRTLTISILPTIASLWLMPRLHLFTQANPGVEVRIISSIEPSNLLAHEADIAIRVGRIPGRRYERGQPRIDLDMVTSWDGVQADELFPDILRPACAPALAGEAMLEDGRPVVRLPLIHTSSRRHAWPDWLRATGGRADGREAGGELEFGHFFMSLDAARQGRGIAIVPDILLAQYDRRAELAMPLPSEVRSAGEYYLLIHESRLDDPRTQAFRDWILAESRKARDGLTLPADPSISTIVSQLSEL